MNTEQLNKDSSIENNQENTSFLDYSLKTCEERTAYVEKLLKELPPEKRNNPRVLENLSNYIINAITKSEKKQRKILTDNRMVTINKRETSFEGITSKLEYEDNFYSMIHEEKQTILTPKKSITKKDLEDIPVLKVLKEEIEKLEKAEKDASGTQKYGLKRWIIEMRQDQYIIKDNFKQPQKFNRVTHNVLDPVNYYNEEVTVSDEGRVSSKGAISLYNPEHIALLLKYYSELKQEAWGRFENDLWFLMEDLDNLIERALANEQPMLYDLLIMKIDGMCNVDIGVEINKRYGKKYTNEYLSSLWRKKIPRLIAEAAEQEYLEWYYTVVKKGHWKKCSRCGQIKLAHNFYFSKNKSSKDGFYSICKCCRNAKTRANKEKNNK